MNFELTNEEFVSLMNGFSARHEQLEHYIKVENGVVARGGTDDDLTWFEAELKSHEHIWDKLASQADKQNPGWWKQDPAWWDQAQEPSEP